jgi:hypothetical protein
VFQTGSSQFMRSAWPVLLGGLPTARLHRTTGTSADHGKTATIVNDYANLWVGAGEEKSQQEALDDLRHPHALSVAHRTIAAFMSVAISAADSARL